MEIERPQPSAEPLHTGPTTRPKPAPASKCAKPEKERPDHTILRPPIQTSVTGLKQAVMALENSTPEVRDYLINECNLIYECKSCSALFRSLSSFICHKRSFCKIAFRDRRHVDDGFNDHVPSSESIVVVQAEEPVDTIVRSEDFDLMDYCPSLALMKELGILKEIENKPLENVLHGGQKKSLENVVKDLKSKVDSSFDREYYRSKELRLESMRYNPKGVFQTMSEQYTDLIRLQNQKSVVVDPFNRVLEPGEPSRFYRETLNDHAISAAPKQVKFPCTVCKKLFTRISTTVQHLIRSHKYAPAKAEQQKSLIKKNAIRVEIKPSAEKITPEQQEDIKRRQLRVSVNRLTDNEISKWLGEHKFANIDNSLKSIQSKTLRVDCRLLSTDEIEKKTVQHSDRIPIKLSLTSKNQTGAISDDFQLRNLQPSEDSSSDVEILSVASKDSGKMAGDPDETKPSCSSSSSVSPTPRVNGTSSSKRKQGKAQISKVIPVSLQNGNSEDGSNSIESSVTEEAKDLDEVSSNANLVSGPVLSRKRGRSCSSPQEETMPEKRLSRAISPVDSNENGEDKNEALSLKRRRSPR